MLILREPQAEHFMRVPTDGTGKLSGSGRIAGPGPVSPVMAAKSLTNALMAYRTKALLRHRLWLVTTAQMSAERCEDYARYFRRERPTDENTRASPREALGCGLRLRPLSSFIG